MKKEERGAREVPQRGPAADVHRDLQIVPMQVGGKLQRKPKNQQENNNEVSSWHTVESHEA